MYLFIVSTGTTKLSRRRFAGAELGSRASQIVLNLYFERMRAAEHAPRDPRCLLERRHSLTEIVERRAVVHVERRCVNPLQPERVFMRVTKNLSRHG